MTGETSSFMDRLRISQLLTPRQLAVAEARAPQLDDPAIVARQLVIDGWITGWQAHHLLAGRREFRLGGIKLLDFLGKGGMASVYKGEHPELGLIAVKVLAPRFRQKPTAVALFLQEGEIATALNHPNLIRTHGLEILDGTYALICEYLRGWDLRNWIGEGRRCSPAWSCECIRQAALGVQEISREGLVHRDLKPSNLMLIPRSNAPHVEVKIFDFGVCHRIGKSAENSLLQGQIVGTLGYLAPEQTVAGIEIDTRADVYSLGCMLFELLTGRNPFEKDSVTARIAAHRTGEVPPIRELCSDIPLALADVVGRMLARNRDDRFADAAAVAEALEPFCSLTGTTVPPTATWSSEWEPWGGRESIVLREDSSIEVWTGVTLSGDLDEMA